MSEKTSLVRAILASEETAVINMARLNVMLADAQPIVREGVASIINTQEDMGIVGECADGPSAIESYRKLLPDVLVLDLDLPRITGHEVIEALRDEFREPRILVLTSRDGDADIYRCLKAGARGYLLKIVPRSELLDAIRTVASGGRAIRPEVASKMAMHLDMPQLTEREVEVLRQVAKGLGNKQIAAELNISEGTVKTHVNSVLTKLNVGGRTEAVTVAFRRGLIRL